MNDEPGIEKSEEEPAADKPAPAVRQQPSKSKARGEQSSKTTAAGSNGAGTASTPGKPAEARPRPFSMSYDGMTNAEYSRYLLNRGSR